MRFLASKGWPFMVAIAMTMLFCDHHPLITSASWRAMAMAIIIYCSDHLISLRPYLPWSESHR
jgi:hypothetical protein